MDMKAIVLARGPRVGFIIASPHASGTQRLDQGPRQAPVFVPEDADFPGPLETIHDWREGMQEDQEGALARGKLCLNHPRDGRMIGLEELLHPGSPLGLPQILVTRNLGTVAHLWNGAGRSGATIGVDHQAREAREHRRAAKARCQLFRNLGDPNVPGDVASQICPLQPEDRKSTRLNSSHVAISYAV